MPESNALKQMRCRYCSTEMKGRIDQKFCSSPCRTAWHNEQRRKREHLLRQTNKILRKNWLILCDLNKKGKTKVSAQQLIYRGFNFNYFTQILITREKKQYRYCYNQGYLELERENYLLVIMNPTESSDPLSNR